MTAERLTNKEKWEQTWSKIRLPAMISPDTRHPVVKEMLRVFSRHLPRREMTALEIGGAPGQFLAYFSKYYGYQASALDYSETGCRKIRENFDLLGLDITIYNRDFFNDLSDMPRFDLVFSLGFIEHFQNVEEVVARHLSLLKEDGFLIVGVPNFRGISAVVLKQLAPELLAGHNLEAMDINAWQSFENKYGLVPLFKGYIGGFEPGNFRRCESRTAVNQTIRFFFKVIRKMVTDPFPGLRKFNSPFWSSYALGVYRLSGREGE